MLPFFGTTAIVIATLTGPAPSDPSDAVRAAQPAAAVTSAAADAPKRRVRQQEAISTNRPTPPTDEQVIRQQLELRVLMPPLSGDGGG
jgi:hypothetical protein